jgi:transposase
MDKKREVKKRIRAEQIIAFKSGECFTPAEREHMIQEYLSTTISKNALWKKYTGKGDHGTLLQWMRHLGYDPLKKEKTSFVVKRIHMKQSQNTTNQEEPIQELTKEELQAKVEALSSELASAKKGLEEAQIRVFAYSTMIDIAEKEFSIPIRKKSDTKP